ncbi:MAG: putative N-acetylmannosamine-6-phosphate 2-epimerase [Deinococcota bacterium]
MSQPSSVIKTIGINALVVSCQPVVDGPLDDDAIVVALALAAEAGGAAALRIEGATRVRAVKAKVGIPVIGIVKNPDEPEVYITPFIEDIDALADAGADIVAFDATQRPRKIPVNELISYGKANGLTLMADCATLEDGAAAHALGCDIIGTTLSGYTGSGYTGGLVPTEPDLELVRAFAVRGFRVMAEGRYNRPEQARQALDAGAWAVTVGTALTRLEVMTSWFCDALTKVSKE